MNIETLSIQHKTILVKDHVYYLINNGDNGDFQKFYGHVYKCKNCNIIIGISENKNFYKYNKTYWKNIYDLLYDSDYGIFSDEYIKTTCDKYIIKSIIE